MIVLSLSYSAYLWGLNPSANSLSMKAFGVMTGCGAVYTFKRSVHCGHTKKKQKESIIAEFSFYKKILFNIRNVFFFTLLESKWFLFRIWIYNFVYLCFLLLKRFSIIQILFVLVKEYLILYICPSPFIGPSKISLFWTLFVFFHLKRNQIYPYFLRYISIHYCSARFLQFVCVHLLKAHIVKFEKKRTVHFQKRATLFLDRCIWKINKRRHFVCGPLHIKNYVKSFSCTKYFMKECVCMNTLNVVFKKLNVAIFLKKIIE